jgi:transcription initiation factor TFIIIB Brf1 subunit/transcription initiation factor TFIIB
MVCTGVLKLENNGLCKHCNGSLIQTRGELVCSSCGIVCHSVIISEDGSAQVPWDHEMSPGKRVHIVDGLGSYIGYHNDGFFHDVKGVTLSSKDQYKFRKLKRKYNLRIKIGNHETDYRSLMSLNRVTSFLGLSDNVRKRAAYLYKIVTSAEDSAKIPKISNHIVLVALCLMVSIRESASNAPVRLSEIVGMFKDLGHRVSGKAIVKLAQNLPSDLGISLRIRRSEDYLQRIASSVLENIDVKKRLKELEFPALEYESKLLQFSREILSETNLRTRGGRNPYIFAVSVVYCADRLIGKIRNHRQVLTQKTLANICEVAEYSIRDHHRTILKEKLIQKISELAPQKNLDIDDSESRFPMLF